MLAFFQNRFAAEAILEKGFLSSGERKTW